MTTATWLNAIGYQLAWFAVVLGASYARPWLGILACAVFVGLQLATSTQRAADVRAVIAGFIIGNLLDGSLAQIGMVRYASPDPGLLAPGWIVALWMAFAMTINHSMRWLRDRPLWFALLGGSAGPATYFGVDRAFSAIELNATIWPAVLTLSALWALALPLLAAAATLRWRPSLPSPGVAS